ncbi:hypothetical protein [Roseovarius mucosus]|uniref:hypothetical protein n=1 Tax=Roseovarius mucosus TaxID=215743 RepID=UPI003F71BE25
MISDFDTAGDLLDLRGVIGGFEGLSIAATTFDGSGATQVRYLDHKIIFIDVVATALDRKGFIFG